MDIHFLLNETMRPLADRWFFRTIPPEFRLVEHRMKIWTSGNYRQDNFDKLMIEKTKLVVATIQQSMDDQVMAFLDVDIVFFRHFKSDLLARMTGFDLLFQDEFGDQSDCNTGLQIVRRNQKTLSFYRRLLDRQMISGEENEQVNVNAMLLQKQPISWSFLPLTYSNGCNGGLSPAAVLYHANCTLKNSLEGKFSALQEAWDYVTEIHPMKGA